MNWFLEQNRFVKNGQLRNLFHSRRASQFWPPTDSSFESYGGRGTNRGPHSAIQLGSHRCGLSSPAFRQPQARQDRFRLPHTHLHSRYLRLEVVDDQPQLVFARRDISRDIKLDQGIDHFIR